MSASPAVNRAARILGLVTPRDPLEAVLRRELAPRRDLPPGARREAAGAVAACFRWLDWLAAGLPPQRRVAAALELQVRFDSDPASFKAESLAARAVPGWLAAEMDAMPPPWLRQLQREPALWIRARRRHAGRLPQALGHCVPASAAVPAGARAALLPDTAFRYDGGDDLFLTAPFRQGWFEIQDLASQLVGHACAPAPGQAWWDACAGEGGKTLHLADLMENRGILWASDRSARRLQVLKRRAARAEVFNYRAAPWNGGPHPPTRARFDGVLVDAPCSGVGTWQRHPDARWTASPDDVRELADIQQQLLGHASGSVKPGGRLVYSVCTLTRAETRDVAARFTDRHPEFAPAAVFPAPGAAESDAGSVLLWPHELDANGMFIAAWRRRD